MHKTNISPTVEEINSELETVLESSHFKRAPALAKFLTFICQEYFAGRAHNLKEYSIAVEAFGRASTFEPKENPIVRVQAIRMRDCLKEYYRGDGRNHKVQIRLPKGQYVPEFRLVDLKSDQRTPVSSTDFDEETPAVSEVQEVAEPPDVSDVSPTLAGVSRRSRLLTATAAVSVIAILLFLGWKYHSALTRSDSTPSDHTGAAQSQTAPLSATEEIRILPGQSKPRFLDQLGRVWGEDRFFHGGSIDETAYKPTVRVEDPDLWRYYRKGDSFEYDIPLRTAPYELHLFFVEPIFGENTDAGGGETSRLFDVFANDQRILEAFDIVGDAGGARTTDEKVFMDMSPSPDGYLHLRFVGRTGQALVNAIALVPALPGRMRPIRIGTRNVGLFSKDRLEWSADRYYSGGRGHAVRRAVAGTEDPELYSTERYGNFSYTIPVAPGTYTAILHFSESYFGSSNSARGGAGSRIFDVYFNGVALMRDFDIYKEAGGENRVLRKAFRGLRPNTLGKLVFTFQPIRNYPCINAIEIIPE